MAWWIRKTDAAPVKVEDEASVGRDPLCEIWIDDAAVSRVHCRFRTEKGLLTLADNSRNGTSVNGIRIGAPTNVAEGDVVDVAGHQLTIEVRPDGGRAPGRTLPLGQQLPRQLPPQPQSSQAHPAPSQPQARRNQGPVPTGEPRISVTGERRIAGTEFPPPMGTSETGAIEPSFEVEIVESVVGAQPTRYRDAARLGTDCVLLVMTDIVGSKALAPAMIASLKTAVRSAGARGIGPDGVLQVLNQQLFEAGVHVAASCARLDVRERVLAVACAAAPPPWVIRGGQRAVRVQSAKSVELGRIRGANFSERRLHFEKGDALLLASTAWAAPLERTLSAGVPGPARPAQWLRIDPAQPQGGCVLCLSMT